MDRQTCITASDLFINIDSGPGQVATSGRIEGSMWANTLLFNEYFPCG